MTYRPTIRGERTAVLVEMYEKLVESMTPPASPVSSLRGQVSLRERLAQKRAAEVEATPAKKRRHRSKHLDTEIDGLESVTTQPAAPAAPAEQSEGKARRHKRKEKHSTPERKRKEKRERKPVLSEAALEVEKKRRLIFNEITSTEEAYSRQLDLLHEQFLEPICSESFTSLSFDEKAPMRRQRVLIVELKNISRDLCARLQQEQESIVPLCGQIFLKTRLDGYNRYSEVFSQVQNSCLQFAQNNSSFRDWIEHNKPDAMDFNNWSIRPIQRICRYELLLKALIAVTPATHPDSESLAQCINMVTSIANKMNESQSKLHQRRVLSALHYQLNEDSRNQLNLLRTDITLIKEWNALPISYNGEALTCECYLLSDRVLFLSKSKNNQLVLECFLQLYGTFICGANERILASPQGSVVLCEDNEQTAELKSKIEQAIAALDEPQLERRSKLKLKQDNDGEWHVALPPKANATDHEAAQRLVQETTAEALLNLQKDPKYLEWLAEQKKKRSKAARLKEKILTPITLLRKRKTDRQASTPARSISTPSLATPSATPSRMFVQTPLVNTPLRSETPRAALSPISPFGNATPSKAKKSKASARPDATPKLKKHNSKENRTNTPAPTPSKKSRMATPHALKL